MWFRKKLTYIFAWCTVYLPHPLAYLALELQIKLGYTYDDLDYRSK